MVLNFLTFVLKNGYLWHELCFLFNIMLHKTMALSYSIQNVFTFQMESYLNMCEAQEKQGIEFDSGMSVRYGWKNTGIFRCINAIDKQRLVNTVETLIAESDLLRLKLSKNKDGTIEAKVLKRAHLSSKDMSLYKTLFSNNANIFSTPSLKVFLKNTLE